MKLIVKNLYTYVNFEEGDYYLKDVFLKRVHKTIGARQDGFQFSPAYKRGSWDGYVDFYDYEENRFPTGLLPKVTNLLGELQTRYSFQYDIEYQRDESFLAEEDIDEEITLLDNNVGEITLRGYQYEAVYNSLTYYNGIVHAATNCITKDTPLLTPKGYKTVEEIFMENGVPLGTAQKEYDVQYPLINRYGKEEKTSKFFINGVQDVFKVETFEGNEIHATSNHPLLVLEEGELVWKKVEDLTTEDYLVTRTNTQVYGNDDRVTDEFEAYCIGVMVADGSYGRKGELGFSNNEQVLDDIMTKYFTEYIGKEPRRDDCETYFKLRVNSVELVTKNFHEKLGIDYLTSRDKRIPECVRMAPKNIQVAFLSGFFECETHIHKNNFKITTKSSSKMLLEDTQRMLANLGIKSNTRFRQNNSYNGKYANLYFADLVVQGRDTDKLLELLDFKTEFRNERKHNLLNSKVKRKPTGSIPGAKQYLKEFIRSSSKTHKELYGGTQINLYPETVEAILRNDEDGDTDLRRKVENVFNPELQFKKIENITHIGKEETYDVCMPETHSFIANTIINHNSGKTEMASGIIDQLLPQLRKGERIAFFTGSSEIFHQSADRLKERLNIPIGKVGAGQFDVKQVTVVMVPTMNASLKDPAQGVKVTPKQNISKKIATEILPKFEGGGSNQKKLLSMLIKGFQPKTKVDQNVKDTLISVYEKSKSDSEVLMNLRAFNADYQNIIREKNTSKYDKYKRMREFLDSVTVMIVDEAHHSKSDTWYLNLMTCENALYRVALTGSIDKKDEMLWMRLQALFGEVIVRTTNSYLIDQGHSARPTINMIPIAQPTDIEDVKEYREAYEKGITNNSFRNKVIAKLAERWYNNDKGVLIIVNFIQHGENISELLDDLGVEHYFLHGEIDSNTRKEKLNDMRSGKLKVMIATSLIDEGVDISGINALILGASGKSLRQTLQRIGRALRKKKDDNTTQIFDFNDMTHRFLLGHAGERLKIYDEEEFEVKYVGKK